jgi:hypothetical protein
MGHQYSHAPMLNLRVEKDLRYIVYRTGWDANLLKFIKPILTFFCFKDQGFPIGVTI